MLGGLYVESGRIPPDGPRQRGDGSEWVPERSMPHVDRPITCLGCATPFVWSAVEQESAARYGLPVPQRCKRCYDDLRTAIPPAAAKKRRSTKGVRYSSRRKVHAPPARPRDERIACEGCGTEFVWTVHQQASFAERGWLRPRRCTVCSQRRKEQARRVKRPVHVVQGGLPGLGKHHR